DDDTRLICMEYVEGKTIRDMVESGIVSVGKAIDIITQAAEALEAAHNKGILHRDIKSANIMVNMEGRVKVMDFGLAQLAGKSQLTRTGTTMGTLSYSSPEQISGRTVDQRSEIFSLGIVFYELLTGKLPFAATNEAEILFAIINNEPSKPSTLRDDVPELVEAVLTRMLEKNPDLRYQNCGEIISDLTGIRKEMETSTVSLTGTLKQLQLEKKKPALLPRIGAIVLVALTITVGAIALFSGSGAPAEQIVVAVFENRTGDSVLDSYGQLISESLAEKLDAIEFLRATSAVRLSATQLSALQEGSDPLDRLARLTDSGTIISGAIYQVGNDEVRIQTDITVLDNPDLITPPEPHVGPRSTIDDMIAMINDQIAGRVAAILDPDHPQIIATPPPSFQAYSLMVQASDQFVMRNWTACLDLFLQVAATDTSYLAPLLMAAVAYSNSGQATTSDSLIATLQPHRSRLSPSEQAHLDWLSGKTEGNLTGMYEASTRMAEYNLDISFQTGYDARRVNRPGEAIEWLHRVPEDSPTRLEWPSYWSRLIESYYMLGRYRHQLKAARTARQLFPQSWSFFQDEIVALAALGRMKQFRLLLDQSYAFPGTGSGSTGGTLRVAAIELHAQGRSEESAALFEEALSWYQSQPLEDQQELRSSIAATHYYADNREEARGLYLQLHEENPLSRVYIQALGCLAARDGNVDEAHRYIDELATIERPARSQGSIFYSQARIAASLGESELALSLLRRAFEGGVAFGPPLHYEMDFDRIRDYPPFQEWIRPKG
ncbi:protein kinase, partial [Gemmatimonadota bacterium]